LHGVGIGHKLAGKRDGNAISRNVSGRNMAAVNVTDFIDGQRFSRLQLVVAIWCGVLVALDGLDVQIIAFVAPVIAPAWGVPIAAFGPIFGLGLLGFMLGALIAGPFADRYGRKPVIVVSAALLGIFSLMTADAQTMNQLLVLRMLTGLGLGGVLPNAVALTSEYAPRRNRAMVIAVMFCGYSIGGGISALVSARLIPAYGWPSAFIFGGVIPLLLVPAIYFWVPESIDFLTQRTRRTTQIAALLNRIAGAARFRDDDSFLIPEKNLKGFTVKHLFTEGRTATTLLLWLAFFCNLLVLYLLAAWLPAMMQAAGVPIGQAIIFTAFLNLGGIIGTCALGPLVTRWGAAAVIAVLHVIAALSTVTIGLAGSNTTLLALGIFGAGFCVIGGLNFLNALAASKYPTAIRSTGVGWGLGIGRIGSILGPIMAGILLAGHIELRQLYFIAAIPALIVTLAALPLGRKRGNPAPLAEADIG
jgi:AAHS family 4-hydroxybenzoate transporter-like MFS transporter